MSCLRWLGQTGIHFVNVVKKKLKPKGAKLTDNTKNNKEDSNNVRINIDPNLKRRFKAALAKYAVEVKSDNINQTTVLIAYITDFCKSQEV